MSDDGGGGSSGGGTDNPAFSHDEDTASYDNSTSTTSAGHNHHEAEPTSGNDEKPAITENGKNHSSFESARTNPEPTTQYKSETRIEVPEENMQEKTTGTPKPKQNGVHGNGNNNDVSFLNSTVTSVTNNDVSDKKEQIEAVNLELVSMKPYAGTNNLQTKNQEACELPADPYEEYFVPVNEHRKFIRGEKLYVTKDKRSTSSYWRRIVCWGCGLLIIAIAAIIAILAGTGVILTQEATQPLLDNQQFNDVHAAGSQKFIKNPPPSPPPATSTFPPWRTTDETLYKLVPKALDGVIKLDDLEWNEDMNDPKSRVYRDVAKEIEGSLVDMLRLNNDMPLIKVYSISKDGQVKFRVNQPIFEKPEDNQDYLENKFRQNGNVISRYHVNRLAIHSLIDQCSSENMGCSDSCSYDYIEGIFKCTCPAGKSLDKSGKNCVNLNDLSNLNFEESWSEDVQGRSRIPDDLYNTHDHHWHDSHYDLHEKHEHPSASEPTAEPKTEPEPAPGPKINPEPATETTSEPEPIAEPKSEPEATAVPKSEPEPTAEPKSEPEPAAEPKSEPDPAAEPKIEPEPAAEPKSEPEPTAEPKSDPEPAAELKSEPEPAAKPKSEPEPVAETKSEPKPSAEPKNEPEPIAEPKSEPEVKAAPKSEPESKAEPKSEPEPAAEPKSELEPATEPKSESEPADEPKSEPEPAAEPKSELEPATEPKSEPEPAAEPKSEPEPTAELKSEPEPAAEPKSEPEPAAEPKSELEPATEPNSEREPAAEPKSEPEPTAEPKSEPEPAAEPKSEPEPAAEPKSELEPATEPNSEREPAAEPKSEPEPTAEPKSEPEPAAEPKSEPKPAAESNSESEPVSETKTEIEPSAEPKSEPELIAEPKSEPEPTAAPEGEPETAAEPKSEPERSAYPKSEAEPIAAPKSEPEATAEPTSEPEPTTKSKSEHAAEVNSGSELVVETKRQSETEFFIEPKSEPEPDSEPKSEPKSQPERRVESKSEVEPVTEPTTSSSELITATKSEIVANVESNSSTESAIDLKGEPESSTEVKSEPEPISESKSESETADEPIPAMELKNSTALGSEPKSEPEPTAESVNPSEIMVEAKSEPLPSTESTNDHEPMLESKSVLESSIESKSNVNLLVESKIEPESSTESKPEFEVSLESKDDSAKKGTTIISEPTGEIKNKVESSTETQSDIVSSMQPKSEDQVLIISNSTVETDKLRNESVLVNVTTESQSSAKTKTENETFEESTSESVTIPETESKSESQWIKDSQTDTVVKSKNEFEFSTISSEPATVIGLSTARVSSELPLEINLNTELNNDSISIKESPKKVPRLDKDEQDSPNPFEGSIKDVITSNINDKTIETTVSYDSSSSNLNNQSYNQANFSTSQYNDTAPIVDNEKSNIKENEAHEVNKKSEENAEDQYNDITDETLPKGFGKNDLEVPQDIKKDENKIQKIYKENKNDYTNSKTDIININKSLLGTTLLTMTDEPEKHFEDASMTSQVPILPIEIQNDMSTTEVLERADTQTTSQQPEKETIITTNLPKMSHVDAKTTEQIPILPEELQTTDANKQEQHTETTAAYQIEKRIDDSSEIEEERTSKSNEAVTNLESMTSTDNIEVVLHKTTLNYNMSNEKSESTVMDDIKPVSETISDDTPPRTFEYKFVPTTTTEKPELPNESEELTEEQLRVVPLEGRSELEKTSRTDDQQLILKKEKELNLEKSSGENYENKPADIFKPDEVTNIEAAKSSRTVEDNNIPKLTSGTSESDINMKNKVSDFNVPRALNDSNVQKELTSSTIKYPNIIPVSEEIDDYQFTEPSVIIPYNSQHTLITKPSDFNEEESDSRSSTTLQAQDVLETSTVSFMLTENSSVNNTTVNDENNSNRQESESKDGEKVNSTFLNQPDFTPQEFAIPVSIIPAEEVSPQIFFSKCKSGQFQCVNGTSRDGAYCVNLSAKCDSENDCSDGSDEVNCEEEGCPGNFQCASGQCLKRHLVCNGIVDCDDGSDEKECRNWKCKFDEFQCPNGRCIPVLWQCDGRPDCENHADEYSCSESCGNDEYLCPIEKWCIPQTWRCNGVSECVNGEDEKLCECALDQFKCETGGCIPSEQLCDGVENCPDKSDEWDCLSSFSKNSSTSTELEKENKDNEFSTRSSLVKIRKSNGDYRFVCSDGWTEEFSDYYCRTLGFASSESTQFVEQGANENLLQLILNASPNASLVINLKKTNFCKSEKIVEVSCQEFLCGSHENVGPTARLVGGTPASEGQWSSVALLKEPKHGAACTASVLSPMHALASYSCIHSYRQSSEWQFFVGGNFLKPHKVKNIVPYPQVKYNQFLYNNDIALVELAEPLVFSRNVSAVCLPSQSLQPRQLCVTAGWGFPVNGEVDLQQYLKFLPVPTYDLEECNATSHYAGFITKHNICAGFTDTDKGPCYNDEGAPLMCVSETGKWEIQGLLSHHSRCSRGHPAIYSSLAPALSWLRNSVPALQAYS